MSVIFVVLPLAVVLAACAVTVFLWAVRSGQFDDLKTPSARILFDEQADRRRGPGQQLAQKQPNEQKV